MMINLFKWVMHGTKKHCSTCQSLSGKVKPMDAWNMRPGFHPHCDCTLEYVGFFIIFKDEPTVFISVLAFPIAQYWDQFNPVKSTNPLMFPLCALISNTGIAANTPFTLVPMADAFPADLIIPVPVQPPSSSHKSVSGTAGGDIGQELPPDKPINPIIRHHLLNDL